MDAVAITVGLAWTLAGLLYAGAAIPLVRGRVPRNNIYGIRIPASFESEDAWLDINKFGGKQIIGWSVPLIAVGIVSFFLPLEEQTALTLILGFAPMVFILMPLLITWHYARKRGEAA